MTLSLIFDTETTGVPARGELVTSPSYPHLVELAALLVDDAGREVAMFDLIVRPDGWTIPAEAAAVHGIDQGMALRGGVPLVVALAAYTNLRAAADEIVGHNVAFDLDMVEAALHRAGRRPAHPGPSRIICTADLGTPLARLPPTERMVRAGYGANFKKPTLTELHQHLFGEAFEGAHGALADCRAAWRCLLEIRRRDGTGA